jgi:hypothetical protein
VPARAPDGDTAAVVVRSWIRQVSTTRQPDARGCMGRTPDHADPDRRSDAAGVHDLANIIDFSTAGTEPRPDVAPSTSLPTSSSWSNAGSLITGWMVPEVCCAVHGRLSAAASGGVGG